MGRTFGVAPEKTGRFDVTRLGPALEEAHERLPGVVIECLPYADFIRRYDRPGTLSSTRPAWGPSATTATASGRRTSSAWPSC